MSYQDLFPLVLVEIIGDFSYKKFANEGGAMNFTAGTVSYIGVVYFLIRSLQGSQILLINAAWDGLSALLESAAAIVFLGETFDDPQKYFGVFLIILGLFFLKMPMFRAQKFFFPKFFS